MKRVWKQISALLVVCAVLAALAPAALADGGADTYRIAVSAVPTVVTAGGSATVSATVYSRSETDGEWSEYLGGGAVITWQAYREGVAAFRGEDADKPVTTALNAGSSSSSLELLTKAGGVTGSAVQLPLSVSVTVGGKTYSASGAFITITPAAASVPGLSVEYAAGFGGSVRFSEADFSKAFSGRGKPGETLDYVLFAVSRATAETGGRSYDLSASGSASMFGALYTAAEDGQALADTDACYYQASFSQLDLDTAAYLTGSYRTRYTVCIPFTAVGTAGTRCEGSAVVTVSGDSTVTASGAFLKTLDAARSYRAAISGCGLRQLPAAGDERGTAAEGLPQRGGQRVYRRPLSGGLVLSDGRREIGAASGRALLPPGSGLRLAAKARLYRL